ncbi:MAG: SGNH/GDSL hydrolase family protein [Spirochaetia bacterium]|nr:SGNH/GDSL hydrolase family protein [Spirochaetia bacterium]
MKTRVLAQNLLLSFVSVLFTYVIFETAYALSGYSPYRSTGQTFQWLVFDPILGWMNKPRYNHDWNFIIDKRGFRILPDAPAEAPRTIVCMGDSGTFGFWADGTWPTFPDYPNQLQMMLGKSTRVVNAGVIGYTSSHLVRQYMVSVRQQKPSYIFVRIGFNDHSSSWDVRHAAYEPTSPVRRFLIYSMGSTFTVQTAIKLQQIRQAPHAFERPWNTLPAFEENLDRLIRYARNDGVKVVLIDYPIRPEVFPGRVEQDKFPKMGWGVKDYQGLLALHRPYAQAIADTARRNQIPLIQTADELERFENQGFSSTDIVHPNLKGYKMIAQRIAEYLQKNSGQ